MKELVYRSVTEAELFRLFLDLELPRFLFPGSLDSDVPEGALGTFWFFEPTHIRFRMALLSTKRPSEGIILSKMRYKKIRFDFDPVAIYVPDHKKYTEHSIDECFIRDRVGLSEVEIQIDPILYKGVMSSIGELDEMEENICIWSSTESCVGKEKVQEDFLFYIFNRRYAKLPSWSKVVSKESADTIEADGPEVIIGQIWNDLDKVLVVDRNILKMYLKAKKEFLRWVLKKPTFVEDDVHILSL